MIDSSFKFLHLNTILFRRSAETLRRSAHWALRFRKRCGYGIHSPFAFGFVTGVVYERGEYYAYSRLPLPASGRRRTLRRKDLRLLFRIMNFQRPAVCLLVGTRHGSAEALWLNAGSCHTHLIEEGETWHSVFDMVYAAEDWPSRVPSLLPRLAQGGMVVVHDICSTREKREAWRRMLDMPQCVVSFDLRDFGIVMYRPELQREHYRVNYF